MNNLFINPELIKHGSKKPASYVRKTFEVDKEIESASAVFSACGLFKAYVNGAELDKQVFLPGFTAYNKRLQYLEYDISSVLKKGKNAVAAIIGEGWWRGQVGISGKTCYYGKELGFLCIINVKYLDGSEERIVTDESWRATQEGAIRANDLKGGETYDATRELVGWNLAEYDDSGWHDVKRCCYPGDLVPYEGERILEQETFTPEVLITPDGSTVLDFKQNLFGYVWFKVNGKKGQKVALIHGECLDESGNFTLKNLGARINNFQRIDYVLKDGVQEYKPTFTAHGFRYVKLIAWPEKVVTENFKSIAVYSEMEEIGTFECSNPMVNRLINNVKWSQRSNFLDIPTDCPTRERAGWTGDISVFAETGSYLFNTNKFLNKWLKDLALQQFDNGIIPNTIPNVMLKMIGFLNGSAGWGDVCYTVPLTLYKMYGNKSTLERQYKSMVKWVGFNERRARRMHWTNLFRFGKESKYIVDRGYHWGEWLEPNHVMVLDSIKSILFKGDAEVATAYFAYSTKILSEIAGILGKVDDRKKYMDLHLKIKDAYLNAFCKNGVIKSDRQCKYVRPLAMDLIGGETANNIALQLNDLVIENGYKIGTGFLSTPWILKVLSDHGYTETAYKMLENTERPSWLYEVKKGATTTWENWNGINDDNVPNNSLNHYAPGAVVAWLFNSVAGIRPLEAGFKKVLVKPIVGGSLTYVNCSYKSAAGKIDIQWRREGDAFKLKLTTPVATEIVLPDGAKFTVNAGSYDYSCKI